MPARDADAKLIEVTRGLARMARSGELVGLCVVAYTSADRFFVDAIGSPMQSPWAARGFVASLDDLLAAECARQHDT
jgi:hypothetical protein